MKVIFCLFPFGLESLDDLAEMVVPLFSEVENKKVTPPEWPQHPFTEDQMKVQLKLRQCSNWQLQLRLRLRLDFCVSMC